MQNYVDHLLDDLKKAKQLAPEKPEFSEDYEEFDAQMLAIENAPAITYEKLMGLSYDLFPPSDMLTELQMTDLIDSITDTFEAFDMWIDIPDAVPLADKYDMIHDLFNEKVNFMPGFSCHFDFCSGSCEDCKIAAYCPTNLEDIEQSKTKSKVINL